MKSILLIFLFISSVGFAQTSVNIEVPPKGAYKDINFENDSKIAKLLLDASYNASKTALIDSVERNANNFSPPVLYCLSRVLFVSNKLNEASYWFYLAQLRARYDANRCTDKTASPDRYNKTFGPDINKYALKHLDTLDTIIKKVVDFARSNEELYDQRWINLEGIGYFNVSLNNQAATKELSVDKRKWPAIKAKTIDTYYSDFKKFLESRGMKH